jgi:hypothetical protein
MMSGATEMELREQLARIDRAQAETQKLAEEARKLSAEEHKLGAEHLKFGAEQFKFSAEQLKLAAEERKPYEEALKLRRDRGLAPWLAVIAISGGIGGVIAGVTSVLHLLGKIP